MKRLMKSFRRLWRRVFGREGTGGAGSSSWEVPRGEMGKLVKGELDNISAAQLNQGQIPAKTPGQVLVANRYGEEVELEAGGDGQVLVANGYGDMAWKEELKERPKHRCDFCKGLTFDDYLGNCAACGAPREAEEEVDPYWNVRTRPRLELWESASTDPGLSCDTFGVGSTW